MSEDWEMRALTAERKARQLEDQLKAERLRMSIEREAQKLGLVDTDAAHKLLDLDAVQYGPDGKPQNVEALLKDLAKSKPYLLGAESGGGGDNADDPVTAAMYRGAGLQQKKG